MLAAAIVIVISINIPTEEICMSFPSPDAKSRRSGLALGAALALGFLGAAASPADARVAVGDSAPDFTLEATDGSEHQLSALRGERKAVLVFFRGAW